MSAIDDLRAAVAGHAYPTTVQHTMLNTAACFYRYASAFEALGDAFGGQSGWEPRLRAALAGATKDELSQLRQRFTAQRKTARRSGLSDWAALFAAVDALILEAIDADLDAGRRSRHLW